MISDLLLDQTKDKLAKSKIRNIVVGLGYIGVYFENGDFGLAATLREDVGGCCTLVEEAGKLTEKRPEELGRMIQASDPIKAGIGLATINAVLNKNVRSNDSSPIEALNMGSNDRVGMIGYFGPLIEPIRTRCKELYVFERRSRKEVEYIYPDWAANVLLPNCDVAIISSTTIINKTLDNLLSLSPERTALLGPSTPLAESLAEKGISHLFGSVVTDSERIVRIISEGGGTQLFGNSVRKINLDLTSHHRNK